MFYFYTKPGCHLCEEAKKQLPLLQEKSGLAVMERNIEKSDEWTEKYGLMIPVIEFQETVIAYGNIDADAALQNLKLEINKQLKK